jgi:hypothetical protein
MVYFSPTRFIVESANKMGLAYFIPCFNGVHCTDVGTGMGSNNLKNISVVAGHFSWDIWQQLPSALGENMVLSKKKFDDDCNFSSDSSETFKVDTDDSYKKVPPCLIMGRNPVERSISYYYQRCFENLNCIGYNRTLNNLTVDELYFLTTSIRDARFSSDGTAG